MEAGALNGIRILEFSQIVAGPFLGCILSDLGAEVVKVERPGGDFHRNWGAVVPHEGKRFQSLNRGKRSIVIDLGQERGREVVRQLVRGFDVVTNNFRANIAERIGIDYDTLRSERSDLIYCQISGWGMEGPMRNLGANDPVICAYSGLTIADAKVTPEGVPQTVSASVIADFSAAFSAAIGIVSALYHRGQTGEGQRIDAALLQAALAIQPTQVMREPVEDATLRDPMVERIQSARSEGRPYTDVLEARRGSRRSEAAWRGFSRAFAAKDGVVQLGAVTPQTRNTVRQMVGIEEDRSDDPDFDVNDPTTEAFNAHREQLITAYIAERTTAELLETFSEAGVPIAPVQAPEELSDDPQVLAAGFMSELEHPLTGLQRVVGPVVQMSATPTKARSAAPTLGADSDDVLHAAGFSPDSIVELRRAGVIE
jgi:crotonobetainyl-CoA:carnitine CoA-transferase CaiB-like acyl-CoA transferase